MTLTNVLFWLGGFLIGFGIAVVIYGAACSVH